ncbi:hypothetical protein C8F04DRAFT_1061952 [Mycena alexandri]|uniref:Uncharacterized protein n=1 Tax=Mycena alexandri TaxID=1745969 RepID=A0AAD6XG69_9AGAR|nr:hypothetical protein C8F04DRAFT_1061952 [Mycena alexandri]
MTTEIEMNDLSKRAPPTIDALPNPNAEAVPDGVSTFWAWSAASLLVLFSLVLCVSPRLLLFLSEPTPEKRTVLTPLEGFLAVHASIWMSAVAVSLVLNIPSIPPVDALPRHQQVTPNHPLLIPLSVAASLSAFLAYNTKSVGSLASIVFVGSSIIGLSGTWAAVFGNSSSVSKKTGADKHTSSFLFGNKSAASAQKKEWRKKQRA